MCLKIALLVRVSVESLSLYGQVPPPFHSLFIQSFIQSICARHWKPKDKGNRLTSFNPGMYNHIFSWETMGKLLPSLSFSYSICKMKTILLLYSLLWFSCGLNEINHITQSLSCTKCSINFCLFKKDHYLIILTFYHSW